MVTSECSRTTRHSGMRHAYSRGGLGDVGPTEWPGSSWYCQRRLCHRLARRCGRYAPGRFPRSRRPQGQGPQGSPVRASERPFGQGRGKTGETDGETDGHSPIPFTRRWRCQGPIMNAERDFGTCPHIHPEVQMDFNQQRRAGADGVSTLCFSGRNSGPLQPVSVHCKGRVRTL